MSSRSRKQHHNSTGSTGREISRKPEVIRIELHNLPESEETSGGRTWLSIPLSYPLELPFNPLWCDASPPVHPLRFANQRETNRTERR